MSQRIDLPPHPPPAIEDGLPDRLSGGRAPRRRPRPGVPIASVRAEELEARRERERRVLRVLLVGRGGR